MEKKYFLQFDFWTESQNKYWSGIVDIDLSETSLNQLCRYILKREFPKTHEDTWAIKVNALNNIDV